MNSFKRRLFLFLSTLLCFPFLGGASNETPFARWSGDIIGAISQEEDKEFKLELRPITNGSYFVRITISNSLVSNYSLVTSGVPMAMQAYRYYSFKVPVPSSVVALSENLFRFHVQAVTGNYTGQSLDYSASINAVETHVMKYGTENAIFTEGPYYITYAEGYPSASSISYSLDAIKEEYDDSTSNKVAKLNYFFHYQNEATSNRLDSFQGEIRVYDYLDDFPLGEYVDDRSGDYRRFPLSISGSDFDKSYATYSFHLSPHLVSRKNLLMREGETATSSEFVSNDFFIPSGFNHKGLSYRFKLILSEIGPCKDEIEMEFSFFHNHEQFGSFYDGDYSLWIGGLNE